MDHIEVAVKQIEAEGEGRFKALVAVFGNIDRVNDRMVKGAFRESLRRWMDSGKRLPVVWSHKADSPDSVIGSADPEDVVETSDGLVVSGQLDIAESSVAKRAWQLLKSGAVSGWSFGYLTKREKRDKKGINELLEVELLEIGPTVSPANLATATLATKGLKAWDGSASNYSDEEWSDACILDRADCDEAWEQRPAKERYAVPIMDPGADQPNPEALASAAAALAEGEEGELAEVCAEAINEAQARLLAAYDELELEPPASIQTSSIPASAKSAQPITIYTFEFG